jgi:ubiquitin conjugation factor E4 B
MRMISYITNTKASCFVRKELLDRMAQMLNHSIVRINGPKQKDIKVQNPVKYKYEAR